MNASSARAMLLALLGGAATLGAVQPALAAPANEAHCRAVGAAAGRLAALRDAGRPLDDAVTTAAAEGGPVDQAALRTSATLLFARFRRMSPENAEFEFYLDCLDDETGAMPAPMPKDGAGR
ncbi:MAG: hypothetical protein H7234_05080 [Herminiimonas sp.]|nr:hypothetical protein [Herminiimonas sp.]